MVEERDHKSYIFKDVPQTDLILACDSQQLMNHYIEGTFTIEDVVTVYAQRSYIIGRKHKYVTEENYEEALQVAWEYD